jgi:anti-sigma-K factor RskA
MNRHVNPEDSDLYALGALDGAEMQELEAHVRTCAQCAGEIDAARQRVALLGMAAPAVAPPARVKEALLRQVRAERIPEAHRAGVAKAERTDSGSRALRFAWLTPVFGVAAVIFAALAAGIWMKDSRDNRRIHELEGQLALAETRSLEIARAADETDKLLGTPGTMRVALEQQAGWTSGRAGVLYNAKMGMVACSGWLPAPPEGKSYQLWLVPMEGKPVPLQVLSGGEWTQTLTAHVTPGMAAKAFAVTVEPKGGMPWPTGPKVLVGGVSQGE